QVLAGDRIPRTVIGPAPGHADRVAAGRGVAVAPVDQIRPAPGAVPGLGPAVSVIRPVTVTVAVAVATAVAPGPVVTPAAVMVANPVALVAPASVAVVAAAVPVGVAAVVAGDVALGPDAVVAAGVIAGRRRQGRRQRRDGGQNPYAHLDSPSHGR